ALALRRLSKTARLDDRGSARSPSRRTARTRPTLPTPPPLPTPQPYLPQSDTASSPGTMGRVRGRRPSRARLPTNARIARNTRSLNVSPARVRGTIFQRSHSVGCAQQTAHTEP